MAQDVFASMMADYFDRRDAKRRAEEREREYARAVREKIDRRGWRWTPNFGIGNAVKEFAGILPGLYRLGKGAVTGDTELMGRAGKGLLSSAMMTANSITPLPLLERFTGIDPVGGLGEKLLGKEFRPSSIFEETFREGGRGLVGPAIEAVGNVAAAGAAAKLAGSASKLGKAAEAARTAETAAAAGYTAEDVANAAKVATRAQRVEEAARVARETGEAVRHQDLRVAEAVLRRAGKAAYKTEKAGGTFDEASIASRQKFLDVANKVSRPYITAGKAFREVGKAGLLGSRLAAAGKTFSDFGSPAEAMEFIDNLDKVPEVGEQLTLNMPKPPKPKVDPRVAERIREAESTYTTVRARAAESWRKSSQARARERIQLGEQLSFEGVDPPVAASLADEAYDVVDDLKDSLPPPAEAATAAGKAAANDRVRWAISGQRTTAENEARAMAGVPPAPWATKVVSRMGPTALDWSARFGGWMAGREVNRVARQITRLQEIDRRRLAYSDALRTVTGPETGKLLGRKITPEMARAITTDAAEAKKLENTNLTQGLVDAMIGDEAMARLSQLDLLEEDLRSNAAATGMGKVAVDAIMRQIRTELAAAKGKAVRGKYNVPTEWLYEFDDSGKIVGDTPLGRAIDEGVGQWRQFMTDEGLAFARESERLGALGISPEELDDLAHAADKTSKAAERTVRDATKAAASAAREVRAVHARYKKALDAYGDEITAAADMIAELRRKKDASLATFDFTRNGLPTVLRTEAKLKATARKIVDTVIRGADEGDGSFLYDLHEDVVVPPGDQVWAVQASLVPGVGTNLVGDSIENMAILQQHVEGALRVYQDLWSNPDVSLAGFYDEATHSFRVEPVQYMTTTKRRGGRPLTRDEAMLAGAARGAETVGQTGPNGAVLTPILPREIAVQLMGNQRDRTRVATAMRWIAEQNNIPAETVDRWMAVTDMMAVRQFAANPGRWKNPGEVYHGVYTGIERYAKAGKVPKSLAGVAVADFFGSNGDISALVRGHATVLRQMLGRGDMRRFERALGVVDGKWTPAAGEKFVDAFKRYLASSEAPAAMEPYFSSIRLHLANVWDTLRDVEPDPHVQSMFDDILGEYRAIAEPPKESIFPQEIIDAAGTPKQRAGKKLPNEDFVGTREAYRRGFEGGEAVARADDIQRQILALRARQKTAWRNAAEIKRILAEHDTPADRAARAAVLRMDKAYGAYLDAVDGPSIARSPKRWKPLLAASDIVRGLAEKDAAIADIYREVPQGLGEWLERAEELGYDPYYVGSLNDSLVKQLVSGTVVIGTYGRYGQEVTMGARRQSRFAAVGNRSLGALAASFLQITHEANSNAFTSFLEDVVAKPYVRAAVEQGDWVGWDPSQAVRGTAWTMVNPIAEPKYMIPKNVQRALMKSQADFRHGVFGTMARVLSPWKMLVLTFSPTWYLNNIVGNAAMQLAEGVSLGDWAKAWKSYRQSETAFGPRGGLPFQDIPGVTGASILSDLAHDAGTIVDYRGGIKQILKSERPVKGLFYAVRRIGRANEVVDEIARAAVYHHGRRTGLSDVAAAQRSFDALVDYNDLSPFERHVVKSVVPFYAWQKGILKVTARLGRDHPITAGLAIQLGNLNRELMIDKFGTAMPEAYMGMVQLPWGGWLNTRRFNPFADAPQLLTPHGIAQSLNWQLEVPLRNMLDAPEGGYSEHRRVNEFGRSVMTTDMLEDFAEVGTGVPVARAISNLGPQRYDTQPTGGLAVARFGGIPYYTSDMTRAIIERTQEANRLTAGLPKLPSESTSERMSPQRKQARAEVRRLLRAAGWTSEMISARMNRE